MKKSNAYLLVGLIFLIDLATLIGPCMLLNLGLTHWARDVMKVNLDGSILGLIMFCLGAASLALWYPYWVRLWMERLTEGPRKRLIARTREDDKD